MRGIYKKLAKARFELQKLNLKKSGKNAFAKFNYYELSDFLPSVIKLGDEIGFVTQFNLNDNKAILNIIDIEDGSVIKFNIPVVKAEMQKVQAIQSHGATITYLRRYLFMSAFEISEGDIVDSLDNTKSKINDKQEKPTQSTKPTKTTPTQPIPKVTEAMVKKINTFFTKLEYTKEQIEVIYKKLGVNSIKEAEKNRGVKLIKFLEGEEAKLTNKEDEVVDGLFNK